MCISVSETKPSLCVSISWAETNPLCIFWGRSQSFVYIWKSKPSPCVYFLCETNPLRIIFLGRYQSFVYILEAKPIYFFLLYAKYWRVMTARLLKYNAVYFSGCDCSLHRAGCLIGGKKQFCLCIPGKVMLDEKCVGL